MGLACEHRVERALRRGERLAQRAELGAQLRLLRLGNEGWDLGLRLG